MSDHGTTTGYRNGCRCQACWDAQAAYRDKRNGRPPIRRLGPPSTPRRKGQPMASELRVDPAYVASVESAKTLDELEALYRQCREGQSEELRRVAIRTEARLALGIPKSYPRQPKVQS